MILDLLGKIPQVINFNPQFPIIFQKSWFFVFLYCSWFLTSVFTDTVPPICIYWLYTTICITGPLPQFAFTLLWFVVAVVVVIFAVVVISLEQITAQKMKFSIKKFLSKCDQISRKLWFWSHLLKKSLMKKLLVDFFGYKEEIKEKES